MPNQPETGDTVAEKPKMTLHDAIEAHLVEKQALGQLSDSTVYNRRYELTRFADYCEIRNIRYPDEIDKGSILGYLKIQNLKKSSRTTLMYILNSFMQYLLDEGLASENAVEGLEKPKSYLPKTDYLTIDELNRLMVAERNKKNRKTVARNLLLFGLFTDICLRVSEVVNLKLTDIRPEEKELWVTRKRGKEEKIPLNTDLIQKYKDWLAIRPTYKGSLQDWVFLSSHGQRLTRRQVHDITRSALKRAGIFKRKEGPHLLRHSGASLKARSGENLIIIQYLLGHENLNTTRRYLHFDWRELKEMVDRSPRIGEESQ